jgi:hypothetical protein
MYSGSLLPIFSPQEIQLRLNNIPGNYQCKMISHYEHKYVALYLNILQNCSSLLETKHYHYQQLSTKRLLHYERTASNGGLLHSVLRPDTPHWLNYKTSLSSHKLTDKTLNHTTPALNVRKNNSITGLMRPQQAKCYTLHSNSIQLSVIYCYIMLQTLLCPSYTSNK